MLWIRCGRRCRKELDPASHDKNGQRPREIDTFVSLAEDALGRSRGGGGSTQLGLAPLRANARAPASRRNETSICRKSKLNISSFECPVPWNAFGRSLKSTPKANATNYVKLWRCNVKVWRWVSVWRWVKFGAGYKVWR